MNVSTLTAAADLGATLVCAKVCSDMGKFRVRYPITVAADLPLVASLVTFDSPDESAEIWFLDADNEFVSFHHDGWDW